MVRRIYVEKKDINIAAQKAIEDFAVLGIGVQNVRLLNRYDVENISEEDFFRAIPTVFSEPPLDTYYLEELPQAEGFMFAVEYLPGQYDQRADCCEQCISLLTMKTGVHVRCAQVYIVEGQLSQEDREKILGYVINPVDSRLAALEKPETIELKMETPEEVQEIAGFIHMPEDTLQAMIQDMGLAMNANDLLFAQQYFKGEGRNPTETEIRVLDTYWSDHCRHTTFATHLEEITFANTPFSKFIKKAYEQYLTMRKEPTAPVTLMDIATVYPKYRLKNGTLPGVDVSDEINACTIKEKVTIDGKQEDYLILFKNETHNHPTEIEPFGGAATCLGGAIRDPLSGRAYVYQAMRVTGCADPRSSKTLEGKLPQRKLTTQAASGYSSYGNQIGIATGGVYELYHPGYVAKRLEIGAVIGAAPANNVVRTAPQAGDVVLLIGGATGRDGCGGATGSSKAHDHASIETCGAEVQKGNPVTERKLQRLFKNPSFSQRIKKCNDFGAGGVCVAIGELSDGLNIQLDNVIKKYEGLNSTELAISESQERMAVVVDKSDVDAIFELCAQENLSVSLVAHVTDDFRMKMTHNQKTVVDLSRELLSSNGAPQSAQVFVAENCKNLFTSTKYTNINEGLRSLFGDITIVDNRGLSEMFDSTIGGGSVLLPFGGKYFGTKSQAMAATVPTHGQTTTKTIMTYGFDPYVSESSPFAGAVYAIVESIAKLICAGGRVSKAYLTLQEYFHRLFEDKSRWGQPFQALLGALYAQRKLGVAAIGGKDSMSGTFQDLDVPPTLVSFAVCATDGAIVSGELKQPGSPLMLLQFKLDEHNLPDFDDLLKKYTAFEEAVSQGKVRSAYCICRGGLAAALAKMSFGNRIGVQLNDTLTHEELFETPYGYIVFEADEVLEGFTHIGSTTSDYVLNFNDETVDLQEIYLINDQALANVFKTQAKAPTTIEHNEVCTIRAAKRTSVSITRPRVTLCVFPGTNCEYDTERIFNRSGAVCESVIIRNLSVAHMQDSVEELVKHLDNSQILMIPGGFSGGDEPDGSGKFIAAVFRHEKITQSVMNLLYKRDGLALGICNGFQALVKLGLLPYGEIREQNANSPTLSFNTIGRHMSSMVKTKITSVKSPWLNLCQVGDVHTVAVSHGEGRFIAPTDELKRLFENGQVVSRYVDDTLTPTMQMPHNPNGSMEAIEGILSPDGRILGKMAHTERYVSGNFVNAVGNFDQKIIESGVQYFR